MKTKINPSLPKPIVIAVVGFFVVILVIGVLITLVGGFIFRKEEVKTDFNGKKEKMTFTDTKTGETVNLGTGQLPADFPPDFPVYPGAKIASSMTGGKEGKTGGFWLNLTTSDSLNKVTDYYKKNLKTKSWEISDIAETEENTIINISGKNLEGTVNINRDQETSIQIILEEKERETSSGNLPDASPGLVVEKYTKATLGTIPGAKIDYETAKQYLSEKLKKQFTDISFVPLSYGIQNGPEKVKITSENISGNEAKVEVDAYYDESPSFTWEFVLELVDNQWKIGKISR